jgi:hypothetical protein
VQYVKSWVFAEGAICLSSHAHDITGDVVDKIRYVLTTESSRRLPTNNTSECYVDRRSVLVLFMVLTGILFATRIATFELAHVTCLSGDWHVMIRALIPVLSDDLKTVPFKRMR